MKTKLFRKKRNQRWSMSDHMFSSLLLTSVTIELSQVGAGFIDGLVISRCLGPEAMAAEGIVHPIYSILGVISGLLAVGMQIRCAQAIGRGNRNEFSKFFSATALVGCVVSLIVTIMTLAFPRPIAVLLGASGNAANLADTAGRYVFGLGCGVFPLIMTAILAPAVQLDSGRKTIQTGAIIELASNVAMDLLAVRMGWGILGIGLATSVASLLNLLWQCSHFLKKDRLLHFVRPDISAREFLKMLSDGGEKAVRRLANIIRPVLLNAIIISYGGSAAMTVLSVRNNFSNFTDIFGEGVAATLSLLVSFYYGEINEDEIHEAGAYGQKLIAVFCGTISVLMLAFARPIARLYINESGEMLDMAVFAIRMLALHTPMHALIMSRIKYLQAAHLKRQMNGLIVLSQLLSVLLSAFILGKCFGKYGILASYLLSDFLTLCIIYLCYAIKTRQPWPTSAAYLSLPDNFHLDPGQVISLDIRNMEDVSLASVQIMLFCKGHQFDRRFSYFASLSFEELAADIVLHGFPDCRSKDPVIDLRAVITEDQLVIRMRDNCPKHDLTRLIMEANAEGADPVSHFGVRFVSKTASDISYTHTFETNNIIISFDTAQPDPGQAIDPRVC